jgi:hypothetical protein
MIRDMQVRVHPGKPILVVLLLLAFLGAAGAAVWLWVRLDEANKEAVFERNQRTSEISQWQQRLNQLQQVQHQAQAQAWQQVNAAQAEAAVARQQSAKLQDELAQLRRQPELMRQLARLAKGDPKPVWQTREPISCMAFDDNEHRPRFVIGTATVQGHVSVWDIAEKAVSQVKSWSHPNTISVVQARDQAILSASSDGTLHLYHWWEDDPVDATIKLPAPLLAMDGRIMDPGLVRSPYDVFALCADNKRRRWRVLRVSGAVIDKPAAVVSLPIQEKLALAALDPWDGQRILTTTGDKTVRLWTSEGKEWLPGQSVLQHPEAVTAMSFYPASNTSILTISGERTVHLWEGWKTLKPLCPPLVHPDKVTAFAFSRDGKQLLTGCADKRVRRWDAQNGQALGEPLVHAAAVTAVDFSPDGKTILTGCRDKTARLWQTATGKPHSYIFRHTKDVTGVAFSPQGRHVLTRSEDGARLWELPVFVADDAERILLWVQVQTGMEMDETGALRPLDEKTHEQRRQRLEKLAGPRGP